MKSIGKAEIAAYYLFHGRYDVFKRALKQLHEMVIKDGSNLDPKKDYIRIEYIKGE